MGFKNTVDFSLLNVHFRNFFQKERNFSLSYMTYIGYKKVVSLQIHKLLNFSDWVRKNRGRGSKLIEFSDKKLFI